MSALDYAKLILDKVSFDQRIFSKEYYKAIRQLVEPEIVELYEWCVKRFGLDYVKASLNLVIR